MIWDMEALPLSITNINTIILQLEKIGDELTVKNMNRSDLDQIKEALSFYHKVHFDMEEINKSVQASNDLVLELVKDKRGVVEVMLDKLEQFKGDFYKQSEKDNQDGLARRFQKKV